jgi:protein TIF31
MPKSMESNDGELELEQTTASEVVSASSFSRKKEEADAARDVTDASNTSEQPKSWADYSDGEVEVAVVAG